MDEIKTNDFQELKNSTVENYQSIKPETEMRLQEARNTWDSVFNTNADGRKSEKTKEGIANGTDEINKDNSSQKKELVYNQEPEYKVKNQEETNRTDEEKALLQKLSSGELDGLVGKLYFTSGGSTVWTEIKDGNPVRYKKGPGGKFFDGKENVRYEGKKITQEKWESDAEKLSFLQKFGWLIENDDVKKYSKRFKPEN